jgi:trigger factor
VERVHELELHPLDDEFAQSLGSYDTYEKLRQSIQQDLQTEQSNTYNRDYIENLIEKIVTDSTVKYPPTALNDEIEHVITHFEERLKRDQLDLETYLKTRSLTREEFIEQETKPVAEKNLKRNLVLEEFSVREKIQISNEEAQMILNMAQNQALQDPSMKSLAKGGVTKKQVAENLARQTINEIFNQRMMNRLRDIATGKADAPVEAPAAEIEAEASIEVPTEVQSESTAETSTLPEDSAEENSQASAE